MQCEQQIFNKYEETIIFFSHPFNRELLTLIISLIINCLIIIKHKMNSMFSSIYFIATKILKKIVFKAEIWWMLLAIEIYQSTKTEINMKY